MNILTHTPIETFDTANSISSSFDTQSQIKNAIRILFALLVAPLVTLGLLYIMSSLIANDLPEPEIAEKIVYEGIFDVPKPLPVAVDNRPTKPEDVELPPAIPKNDDIFDNQDGIDISFTPNVVHNPNPGIYLGDSDSPIRLVAVAPQYPNVATARGIEGYVDVQFDVTKAGTTENITIIGYEPSKVFNRSVLRAIPRWRYQPKTVNGEPVATKGVVERVRFNIET